MGGGKLSITQTHNLKNIQDLLIANKIFEDYVVARTPEIFDINVIEDLRDRYFLGSMLKCVLCLKAHHEDTEDKTELLKLRKQLLQDAKKIKKFSFKTRVTYILFKFCPCTIPLAQKCWQLLKALKIIPQKA